MGFPLGFSFGISLWSSEMYFGGVLRGSEELPDNRK